MITEDYCSYEVAKLLEEKGFDESCDYYYSPNDDGTRRLTLDDIWCKRGNFVKAPTHQMAMKWLREVKGIYINVRNTVIEPLYDGELHFAVDILDRGKGEWVDNDIWGNSYEEAVEAALKYSLENLI